ncbi:hypothetical protein [Pseudomonas capeferrum]
MKSWLLGANAGGVALMKEKDRIAAGCCRSFGQSLAFLTLSFGASFATGFFCLTPDAMIAPIFYSGEFP